MPNRPTASEKGRACARAALLSLCALLAAAPAARAQKRTSSKPAPKAAPQKDRASVRVPQETLLQIVQAEDERRWEDSDLGKLFSDPSAAVRARAEIGRASCRERV